MSDLSRSAADIDAVLALIIPRSEEGRLPAAGELGLSSEILAKAQDDPGLAASLGSGLERLSSVAAEEGAGGFAQLSEERRLVVLNAVDEVQPDFVQSLLPPTYIAYYAHPRVAHALGLETWPPHPEGFPLEQGDLSLLDAVRDRGARYRDV